MSPQAPADETFAKIAEDREKRRKPRTFLQRAAIAAKGFSEAKNGFLVMLVLAVSLLSAIMIAGAYVWMAFL